MRQLAAAGQPIQVMMRRPSWAPLLAGLDVEPLYGDLRLRSELDLVPRYRGVLEGTPACHDGFVAFVGAIQSSVVRDSCWPVTGCHDRVGYGRAHRRDDDALNVDLVRAVSPWLGGAEMVS